MLHKGLYLVFLILYYITREYTWDLGLSEILLNFEIMEMTLHRCGTGSWRKQEKRMAIAGEILDAQQTEFYFAPIPFRRRGRQQIERPKRREQTITTTSKNREKCLRAISTTTRIGASGFACLCTVDDLHRGKDWPSFKAAHATSIRSLCEARRDGTTYKARSRGQQPPQDVFEGVSARIPVVIGSRSFQMHLALIKN